MKIAIIGAGLIGQKRAKVLPKKVKIKWVCDIDETRAIKLAGEYNARPTTRYQDILADPETEAVIIATTNNFLSPIASHMIGAGKHILIEKPGAKNKNDFQKIINAYRKNKVVVSFGYNHRFHPAIIKAKKILDSKKYGPILFIRAKYGHGARPNYHKEWRFNPDIAGGGELLDQGSHLIDLTNYFFGTYNSVAGFVSNLYWQAKLEDSAFFLLKNKKGQLAQLSATCVEWKNIFEFEIMLKNAKIQINGLGRSYGEETLTLYKMKPEMGPPDVQNFKFIKEDKSWELENKEFFKMINNNEYSDKGIQDAFYVLKIIDKLYKLNKPKKQ